MKKIKNKKGFTLIELLAVIVILGLLMAIAIPSVTRYITQSRKKTLTTTMGNYMGALVNEVNDSEYTLTESNTVYAVPIECIALERGGNNPFGEWLQANDKYWAYVLVQYDDINSSYKYGFTFKDSSGYGLYPTAQNKLSNSDKDVRTGLSLTRPKNGKVTTITDINNWAESGFAVDTNTNLVVLQAESEGKTGDGVTTCTLQQKGNNYAQVEEEKKQNNNDDVVIEDVEDYTLMATTKNSTTAFWGYRDKIKTITFQDNIDIPDDISDEHKWDISKNGSGKVMAYIKKNASNSSYYDLYIQGDGKLYANADSSFLFYYFWDVTKVNNLEILNVSNVTDMSSMFEAFGTGNVSIDLSNWDTSKVTNMSYMFSNFATMANDWSIGDLSNWDVSNVTDMQSMFNYTGGGSTKEWYVGDLSNWDTSKVTNMSHMFNLVGENLTSLDISYVNKWDVSSVTDMRYMFSSTGIKSNSFNLDLSKWNVSKVTDMSYMFSSAGHSSGTWSIGDLSDWDVSNVTNMSSMFSHAGYKSGNWNIGDLKEWNVSNVTDMRDMFKGSGHDAVTWKVGDLSNWDTSNVKYMGYMFSTAGYNAAYTLDLSKWNVGKVTNNYNFNYGVETKIVSPTWVK